MSRKSNNLKKRLAIAEKRCTKVLRQCEDLRGQLRQQILSDKQEREWKAFMCEVDYEPAARMGQRYALRLMFTPDAFIGAKMRDGTPVNIDREIWIEAEMVGNHVMREIRKVLTEHVRNLGIPMMM